MASKGRPLQLRILTVYNSKILNSRSWMLGLNCCKVSTTAVTTNNEKFEVQPNRPN